MLKNKMQLILTILVLIFAISCKGKVEADKSNEILVIEHELGTTQLSSIPKRVVVFDYGILDILDSIGVEPIALVKRDFPERLAKYQGEEYENIGTLFEPNFEKLFELKPDVIFISGRQRNLYKDLSEIAPVVFFSVDGPTYLKDLERNARIIGKIFNKENIVDTKLEQINKEIYEIEKQANNKNALFLMVNGSTLTVYGLNSRFDHLYSLFSFKAVDENIEIVNHGNRVSYEYLYEKNPEYLFIMDRASVVSGENSIEPLLNNNIVRNLDAYKNNNIILLDTFSWYLSAGGFESTAIIIEDVKSAFN